MANPNPDMSGLTPFKPGQIANPGGKTSEHRKLEVKAAELAAKIQFDLVSALAEVVKDGGPVALEQIKGDVLKLIKDAQDRGYGAPVQPTTDGINPDMTPTVINLVPVGVKPPER
jgi:hypothetical protein